jgi:methionyl-tRNA formyltransferase
MQSVIVLGKGELGIRVAKWFLESPDYRLVTVVPVMPEPGWAPSLKAWCLQNNVPIAESGHFKNLEGVNEPDWKVDLAVSVFYDKIIKDWFIKKCRRIVNIHNGPLPKYRGVSPINWALKNGEIEHGVTMHEITPGIDDGPIIAQVKYSIYPEFDEVIEVFNRALEYAWTLFQTTMPNLDRIKARPQVESEATYYNLGQNNLLGERRSFRKQGSLETQGAKH